MAKQAGRLCVIKKNTTTIAGARTVSYTSNGTPIDVTDQGDSGVVNYLASVLIGRSVELTIEGYEEDQVLRDISRGTEAGHFLTDLTFEFPNGDEISGNFVMTAYAETGAYEDGQTFTATFASNGAVGYNVP